MTILQFPKNSLFCRPRFSGSLNGTSCQILRFLRVLLPINFNFQIIKTNIIIIALIEIHHLKNIREEMKALLRNLKFDRHTITRLNLGILSMQHKGFFRLL